MEIKQSCSIVNLLENVIPRRHKKIRDRSEQEDPTNNLSVADSIIVSA